MKKYTVVKDNKKRQTHTLHKVVGICNQLGFDNIAKVLKDTPLFSEVVKSMRVYLSVTRNSAMVVIYKHTESRAYIIDNETGICEVGEVRYV